MCVCLWAALRRLGVKGVEIRKPEQLESVTSLIIPGGESTTMAKLAEYHNLVFPSFSPSLLIRSKVSFSLLSHSSVRK